MLRWFQKTPPAILAGYVRFTGVILIAVLLLVLAAIGKLNWLFALIGVFIAFVVRLMPYLLRYAPELQKLWFVFKSAKQGGSRQSNTRAGIGKMSVDEAYEILGLKPGATKQEIVLAHRRLIQKVHPDRGGSDFLATKINLAKDVLLDK